MTNIARKGWRVRAVFCFCALLLGAGPSRGQGQAGAIRGQVTDPSGGVLVGATVLLTTPNGDSMDTTTNKDGIYEFKNLAAGEYTLRAQVLSNSSVRSQAEQGIMVTGDGIR